MKPYTANGFNKLLNGWKYYSAIFIWFVHHFFISIQSPFILSIDNIFIVILLLLLSKIKLQISYVWLAANARGN